MKICFYNLAIFMLSCGGAWYVKESDQLGIRDDAFEEIGRMISGGRIIEAKTALERLPGTMRDKPGWAYLMARAYMGEGDYAQALVYFGMARERKPDSLVIENDYAVCLVMSGRPREGVAILEDLMKKLPDDRNVKMNNATAKIDAGQGQVGRDVLANLAASDPLWFQVRYNLGLGHLRMQEPGLAIVEFEAALKLKVGDKNALLGLATACEMNKDYPCAERAAREVLARYPTDPYAIMAWGVFLEGRGEYEDAFSQYQKATQLNPNCADCWYNFGRLAEKRGDISTAISAYNRYITLGAIGESSEELRQRIKSLQGEK